MLANDAETALTNVLYPSVDGTLDPLKRNSHCRELVAANVQTAHKSWMLSKRSILFDLHRSNSVENSSRSLLPKGISPKAGRLLEEEAAKAGLQLSHDNFSDHCGAGRNSDFDHSETQEGFHRVGTDVHPARNFLAA